MKEKLKEIGLLILLGIGAAIVGMLLGFACQLFLEGIGIL